MRKYLRKLDNLSWQIKMVLSIIAVLVGFILGIVVFGLPFLKVAGTLTF